MAVEQIKEQSEVMITGEFTPERTALVETKMATLPVYIQQEIRLIVEDRVEPPQSHVSPASGG
jgi:hypothetical protein